METAEASSPAHITGFFQICNNVSDPLLKGSKGAGVSLEQGVKTTVSVEKNSKETIDISINGQKTKNAPVSLYLANFFLNQITDTVTMKIDHSISIPMGAGFGTSGAGALSLALALNEVLHIGLSKLKAAQVAHVAEIYCRTGLGTVIAEYFGGLEMRIKPGAPGVGKVQQIPISEDYTVICLSFGSLPTKKFLTNSAFRETINEAAPEYIVKLDKNPSLTNFLRYSRGFAERTGLINSRIRKILDMTDKQGFICSMPMFGDGVFSVVNPESAHALSSILKNFGSQAQIITSKIDFKGPKVY
jgi:pantoate kinase